MVWFDAALVQLYSESIEAYLRTEEKVDSMTTNLNDTSWQTLPRDSSAIADAVRDVVRALWTGTTATRTQQLDLLSRYENCRYTSTNSLLVRETVDLQTSDGADVCLNSVHSIVSTVVAKVAAQQPKVRAVCTDADWSVRRRGRKLDQFVEGLWSTRQEPYANIWELCAAALQDALVCRVGHVKTEADLLPGKVRNTKPLPWEVLFDPLDCSDGRPRHMFQHYTGDRDELALRFPEKATELGQIELGNYLDNALTSVDATASLFLGKNAVTARIPLYEWWSLPLSEDSPGRHVLASENGLVLIDGSWERTSFPILSLHTERDIIGRPGLSLAELIASIDDELNDLATRISRATRLTSMAVVYRQIGTTNTTNIADDDCITIDHEGPNPGIKVETPEPVSEMHLQLLRMWEDAAYRYSGISQATATAQKPAGVDSGIAIRMLDDRQSERLSQIWESYQSLFIGVAHNSIASVRELFENGSKIATQWAGNGFLRSINWEQADLDEDAFVFQLAKAPTIKDSPADRAQRIEEYFAKGILSADAYAAAMSSLDTAQIDGDDLTKQRQIIDSYIETWLDATPEEIDEGVMGDGTLVFRSPIRWLPSLEDALMQVASAYLQAELDSVPDENRELFLRWIELCDGEISEKLKRLAQLQQPPSTPTPNLNPTSPVGGMQGAM